jgi:hypothetical protein
MNKEEAKEHILKHLEEGDELVGFFVAQSPFPIWWFLLLGPLGILFLKTYFVAVTKNGINFHRLSLMGKFKDEGDFFRFSEIENVKIKNGILQRPMIFTLKNGIKVKIKAQLKGIEKVAKLTEETQKHIENNIPVAA